MNKNLHVLVAGLFMFFGLGGKCLAEVQVSGLLDIIARDTDNSDITNTTFRGYSNFHTSRSRVFIDAEINDNSSAFIQFLIDNGSYSLFSAYVRFENVLGNSLNIQIGYLPHPVGTFGARSYSNINPLIGTPLVYNYHSSFAPMRPTPVGDIDNLISFNETRGNWGLPVIYDACWNSGVEFYGNKGKFGYSLGLLAGSISKPLQQQAKNTPQVTTRLSYTFDPGFSLGGSAYYGPYLVENMLSDSLPVGASVNDYINSGIAYDLYFARGYFEFYSEAFLNTWEYPNLENLSVLSGYAEGKYKLIPSWYVAGRFGWFTPGKVQATGGEQRWDLAVVRYEIGIGHWLSRNAQAKLVTQINRFDGASQLDSEDIALQLSINLR